jgi:Aldehyde dehydrogenase family
MATVEKPTIFEAPGQPGSPVQCKARYENGSRNQGRQGVDQLLPPLPAHAAFGGYKSSGVGRENHKMMLEHYSQTKCLLVGYDKNPMGLF